MSISVNHFVVHRLLLADDGKLHFVARPSAYEASAEIDGLAYELHQSFSAKPGKGIGGFVSASDEPDEAHFARQLNKLQANELDFYAFSVNAGELLLSTLVNEGMVESGYLIFSHYNYLATDYLLIALVDAKQHLVVNQNLDVNYATYLDVGKMQIAVRFDLSQLLTSSENNRYISFIKGRMGRKVSDFFSAFIGCAEEVDIKQQNKQVLSQVDSYMAEQGLDPAEKLEHRASVANYVKDQLANADFLELTALAEHLPKDEDSGQDFVRFNQQQAQPLEHVFQPDPALVRSMSKFSGSGGGISLNFDRKLLGDSIIFDPVNQTLSITKLPPNLLDQLLRSQNN